MLQLTFWERSPHKEQKGFPQRLVQTWLCVARGSGSSLCPPSWTGRGDGCSGTRCCEAVETPSRDGAELSVSRAAPQLEPASGTKQRSTIYKAEFINLLTCFNKWMGFVLNFGSLSFPLYWLIPHTVTNLGFGANFW